MSEQIDFYHKWLGIPADQRPPNHYQLLGLQLFESDPDVITSSADRQMGHLRTFQIGRYAAQSQKLLNEVAAAKTCLLVPEKRANYDQELRAKLAPPPAAPAPKPRTRDMRVDDLERAIAAAPAIAPPSAPTLEMPKLGQPTLAMRALSAATAAPEGNPIEQLIERIQTQPLYAIGAIAGLVVCALVAGGLMLSLISGRGDAGASQEPAKRTADSGQSGAPVAQQTGKISQPQPPELTPELQSLGVTQTSLAKASVWQKYAELVAVQPLNQGFQSGTGGIREAGYWTNRKPAQPDGYYVYDPSHIYIWKYSSGATLAGATAAQAVRPFYPAGNIPDPSLGGKYADLLYQFEAPEVASTHGANFEGDYWDCRKVNGQDIPDAGYWVYSQPNWYIWKTRHPAPPANPPDWTNIPKPAKPTSGPKNIALTHRISPDPPIGQQQFLRVVGSNVGQVCGTDCYRPDSDLPAVAVHAGVVRVGEMAIVKVTHSAGPDYFLGTTRNGIVSKPGKHTVYGIYLDRASDTETGQVLDFEATQLRGLAKSPPAEANPGNKYSELLTVFPAPEDEQYRNNPDAGYRADTTRGHASNLPPGYWVYVEPNWYIWKNRGAAPAPAAPPAPTSARVGTPPLDQIPPAANPGGRYAQLLKVFPSPQEAGAYRNNPEAGHWSIGSWAGTTNIPPGYWVYAEPNWYIWGVRNGLPAFSTPRTTSSTEPAPTNDPLISRLPTRLSSAEFRAGAVHLVYLKGASSGSVWGTDFYTSDSSLSRAAVHAGVVHAGESAVVKVSVIRPREDFVGSFRNEVQSSRWSKSGGLFAFTLQLAKPEEVEALAQGKPVLPSPAIFPPGVRRGDLDDPGQTWILGVTGDPDGSIWGSDIYTASSPVATVAVHAGLVKPGEMALVKVTSLPKRGSLQGVERNGVTSKNWSSIIACYRVEKPTDEEILEAASKEMPAGGNNAGAPARSLSGSTLARASNNGKYSELLRTIACPEDAKSYGPFSDTGHYSGTTWHQYRNLPPGYWVYVTPNWYIWNKRN